MKAAVITISHHLKRHHDLSFQEYKELFQVFLSRSKRSKRSRSSNSSTKAASIVNLSKTTFGSRPAEVDKGLVSDVSGYPLGNQEQILNFSLENRISRISFGKLGYYPDLLWETRNSIRILCRQLTAYESRYLLVLSENGNQTFCICQTVNVKCYNQMYRCNENKSVKLKRLQTKFQMTPQLKSGIVDSKLYP